MLLNLNYLIEEYELAIKTNDENKKRIAAKNYKKAYKHYQIMMVDE